MEFNHYFFIEQNTGEQFLVGAYDWDTALEIAESVAEDLDECPDLFFGGILTDDEAEASGLDEW